MLAKALKNPPTISVRQRRPDHKSMPPIAKAYGIDKPEEWEIKFVIETRIDGLSTFVKARLFSAKVAPAARANMVWDSMTKLNRPRSGTRPWAASPGGSRSAIDPRTGDKIGVVSKVRWTNLALTAQPVNQHVNQVATIPFGVLGKILGRRRFRHHEGP